MDLRRESSFSPTLLSALRPCQAFHKDRLNASGVPQPVRLETADYSFMAAEPSKCPIMSEAVLDTMKRSSPTTPYSKSDFARSNYIEAAASDFGERFAHRLRWAHAVNSKRRLSDALAGRSHFLEADVAAGRLTERDSQGQTAQNALWARRIVTTENRSVIMAHYPTQLSSDLSLAQFIATVIQHNEHVFAAMSQQDDLWEATNSDTPLACTDDEALAFSTDAKTELDKQATMGGSMMGSCIGSRKNIVSGFNMARKTSKGIKLDFKMFACVEPAIEHLREIDAVNKLKGHLWLNADVVAGPGALMTPLDAQNFVRLCAEKLPDAVLSLGFGSTFLSTTRQYTHDMIDQMIQLCMCPSIRHSLPLPASPREEDSSDSGSDDDLCICPAAKSRHITFAVSADFALASKRNLKRLLDSVPGASLTIYSGVGSLGVSPCMLGDFVKAFGASRCFMDLKVAGSWSGWMLGSPSDAHAKVHNFERPSACFDTCQESSMSQATIRVV